MHIVMVTPFVDKTGRIDGGVAGVSKYLSDEFVKRKDVKVMIVVPNATDDQIEQFENITVYRIGKKGPCAFLPAGVYGLFVGKRQLKSLLLDQFFLAGGIRFAPPVKVTGYPSFPG